MGLDDRPVLVLDFGAQYAQLIARRVRECRVRSELVPHDITPEEVLAKNPYGLILSGGPASIYAEGAPLLDEIRAALARYVILPSPDAAVGVVLWILGAVGRPVGGRNIWF